MKLMKIFGMVFALHVALACVLVLIQGCRSSTPHRAAASDATVVTPIPSTPPSDNWSNQGSAAATAQSDSYYTPPATTNATPLSGLSPAERARTEPTRPANPGDFIRVDVPQNTTISTPAPAEPADYVVRSGDSFWRISRAHNTTIAELQRLNPGVKPDSLRPGMTIKVPGSAPAAPPSPGSGSFGAGVTSTAASSTYVVRAGDSLSKIAARNGTTVAALRELNGLRSDVIQVGQTIQIPGGSSSATGPAPSYDVAPLTPPGGGAEQVTFVVQRGDTLGEIARKFDVTVSELMAANNITDPRRIRVGQKLVIPGFEAVGSGSIPRSTPAPATRLPAPASTSSPLLPPPGTSTPPAPAPSDRPPELDAPPGDIDAPPVKPLDDPVPAP